MLAGVFLALALRALDPFALPATGQAVHGVVIRGNTRTRTSVIRNEITTRPGAPFDAARWAADVQRVRDLGLFWTTHTTAATSPRGVDLYLTVEDKWTLIPLLGFNRNDDVTEWTAGLYEANFLGLNHEVGFKIARKRAGNTYSLWNSAPRIGASDYDYYVEANEALSNHVVYDPASGSRETVVGYYTYSRSSFYVDFGRRFDPDAERRAGLVFYVRSNRYSLLDDTAEERAANERSGFEAPPYRYSYRGGLRFSYGKMHYDDYLYRGRRLTAFWLLSYQPVGRPEKFERLSVGYTYMTEPWHRHNAGVHVALGTTGSPYLEDAFSIGGLGEVRGFPDERFYGRNLWLVNAEYRYPALDNRWVLGQVTGFVDAGRVWNGALWTSPLHDLSASTGAGVRFVVKPIVSMMVRWDYAQTWSPYRRRGYSLGISQFF
jgi:outer membrane protein assembly factor BamA